MTPREIESLASVHETAVSPLNVFSSSDVALATGGIDAWLGSISAGSVTLVTAAMHASPVPVLGNVMALVDSVADLVTLAEGESNAAAWTSLSINLIGLYPGADNLVRPLLRPCLHLLRQAVGSKSSPIGESLLARMQEHLNATLAGSDEGFIGGAIEQLDVLLAASAELAQRLAACLSSSLVSIAEGRPGALEVDIPAPRYELKNDYPNALAALAGALGPKAVALQRRSAPSVAPLKPAVRASLLEYARRLDAVGAQAQKRLSAQSSADTPGTIGHLLAAAKRAIAARPEKVVNVNIGAHGVAVVLVEHGGGPMEAIRAQVPVGADPNLAKQCHLTSPPACTTGCSISFATGSETVVHTDFVLPGLIPIAWQRCYHSPLVAYDREQAGGRLDLGARWITPYTVRIDQAPDGSLTYFAADGRAHRFPRFSGDEPRPFSSLPIEDLVLIRGPDGILVLVHHNTLTEFFQLVPPDRRDTLANGQPRTAGRAVRYRLSAQRDAHGHTLRLGYHHPGGQLSDIVSGDNHVGTALDSDGRLQSVWLVEETKGVRELARYAYAPRADGSADLVEAHDENRATWRYAYLEETHLLARYTDRTDRGMQLQWVHPDGPGVPLTPENSAQARAFNERSDCGSFETTLVWNRHIRLTTVIDALGHQTRYYADQEGYPYRIVHPAVKAMDGRLFAHEEWLIRDARKNVTNHQHPDGTEDRYEYDERGNLVRHQRGDSSILHFVHDENDRVTGLRDAEGHAWHRRYDGPLLLEETDPLGHATRYAHDASGQVTEITDAKGGKRQFVYSAPGQLASATDCSGQVTRLRHDERGRVVEVTLPSGASTEYAYEGAHLARLRRRDCGEETFEHDAEGRLLRHRDPRSKETTYGYNRAGLLIERCDARGNTLHCTWNRLGQLTELQNENGAVHRFEYDPRGRLIAEVHFDGVKTSYLHQPETGVLRHRVEGDTITELTLDPLGRLTGRTGWRIALGAAETHKPADAETERFAYDGNGRLVDASNAAIRLQWFHDAAGRVQAEHHHSKIDAEGRIAKDVRVDVWQYRHDELGNRIETTRPDGHVTGWLRYGSGYVHGLTLDGTEVLQFERDAAHRETLRTQANGLAEVREYRHPAGWLTAQRLVRGESHAAFDSADRVVRKYQYDPAGLLVARTGYRQCRYSYDPIGQLTYCDGPLGHEGFAYDPAGNPVDPWLPEGRSPNRPDNRLNDHTGTHFDYDARGNLVRRKPPSEAETRFRWDAFGRMVESRRGSIRTLYLYDPLGRRLVKRNEVVLEERGQSPGQRRAEEDSLTREMQDLGFGTTRYGWDGDVLAWERNDLDNQTIHYLHEAESFVPLLRFNTKEDITEAFLERPADLQVAYMNEKGLYDPNLDPLHNGDYAPGIDAEGNGPKPLEKLHFYQCDHLGTPMMVTDELGNIAWSARYQAFGMATVDGPGHGSPGKVRNDIRFQGQYFDRETGFHYNRHRYYDPSIRRYAQSDPIGVRGGVNTYAYVGGNPLRYVDPLGLYTEVVYWHGVGVGESQFGHISTNINGQNFSWGPPGQWDTKYPLASDFNARQQTFRDGNGVILNLTPAQEKALAACMGGTGGKYSITSNNCGTSVQDCLQKVGVQFDKALRPKSIFDNLGASPSAVGSTFYPGPPRDGGPLENPFVWGF